MSHPPGSEPPRSKIVHLLAFAVPCAMVAVLLWLLIAQRDLDNKLTDQVRELRDENDLLKASDSLRNMKLATLDVKDSGYTNAKITVAWDANRLRGIVAAQNLAAAPAGRDYQLWILDPAALAPISAGVLNAPRSFTAGKLSTALPGFAVSLEPAGGSPAPTGPILFAVAPGP